MHLGRKGIQNLLVNIVLDLKKKQRHKFEKTPFHAFSFMNGLNKFQFGNTIQYMMMTYGN
jgi:hypothetical protein